MPEDQIVNTTFTGNALTVQPGKVAFSIFDSSCRMRVGAYGSLGGVKINHKTQVLTQEAKVIPGLYPGFSDLRDEVPINA